MFVIDADSHLIEPLDWLDRYDARLAGEFRARSGIGLGEQLLGEILSSIPPAQRPPLSDLFPPAQLAVFNTLNGITNSEERETALKAAGLDVLFNPQGGWEAHDRLAFLDEHKIDAQLCLPTFGIPTISAAAGADPALGLKVAKAFNGWATEIFAGHTDRLIPVVYAPLEDPAAAEEELRRGRERGARGWLMPLNPVAGRTLGHPDYDRLWAASMDLGITPIVHQGLGWAHFDPAWGQDANGPSSRLLMSYIGMLIPVVAQMSLASMIHGGVFDRFPDMKVMVQELGIGWIDEWIERIGPTNRLGGPNFSGFFPWEHNKTPDQILAENLRFTPLRGQRVDEVIEKFGPDLVMYASDYPHPEGIQVDWSFYDRQFEGKIGEPEKRKFFGETAADVLGLEIPRTSRFTADAVVHG